MHKVTFSCVILVVMNQNSDKDLLREYKKIKTVSRHVASRLSIVARKAGVPAEIQKQGNRIL